MKTKLKISENSFKALACDVRLRILCILLDGKHCVCDIENALSMSQPSVSQHLSKLENSGIIISEKQGKWKYYSLSANELLLCLIPLLKSLKTSPECCEDVGRLIKYTKNRQGDCCE